MINEAVHSGVNFGMEGKRSVLGKFLPLCRHHAGLARLDDCVDRSVDSSDDLLSRTEDTEWHIKVIKPVALELFLSNQNVNLVRVSKGVAQQGVWTKTILDPSGSVALGRIGMVAMRVCSFNIHSKACPLSPRNATIDSIDGHRRVFSDRVRGDLQPFSINHWVTASSVNTDFGELGNCR